VLSGRSSSVLKNFSLTIEPGVLGLYVEAGAGVFLIERGLTHFDTLANLIGCKLNVQI